MIRQELINIISKDENVVRANKELGHFLLGKNILTVQETDLRVEAFDCGLTMIIPLEDLYVAEEETCPTCHMDGVPEYITIRSSKYNIQFDFTK